MQAYIHVKLDFQDGKKNESLDCILLSVLVVMLGCIFFLKVILGESSVFLFKMEEWIRGTK